MQPTPEDIAAADRILDRPRTIRAYCRECMKMVLVVQPHRNNNLGLRSYIEGMCGTCGGMVRVIA